MSNLVCKCGAEVMMGSDGKWRHVPITFDCAWPEPAAEPARDELLLPKMIADPRVPIGEIRLGSYDGPVLMKNIGEPAAEPAKDEQRCKYCECSIHKRQYGWAYFSNRGAEYVCVKNTSSGGIHEPATQPAPDVPPKKCLHSVDMDLWCRDCEHAELITKCAGLMNENAALREKLSQPAPAVLKCNGEGCTLVHNGRGEHVPAAEYIEQQPDGASAEAEIAALRDKLAEAERLNKSLKVSYDKLDQRFLQVCKDEEQAERKGWNDAIEADEDMVTKVFGYHSNSSFTDSVRALAKKKS